jgi:uncharacterized membrane protein YqjE
LLLLLWLLSSLLLLTLLMLLLLLLLRRLSAMFVLALLPLLRWRRFVSPPIRLVLLWPILSVRWSNRPQKQKHRHRAKENEFHKDHPLC